MATQWQEQKKRFISAALRLLRNTILDPSWPLVAARHSGRATRGPESKSKNLDSRLRGNDEPAEARCFCFCTERLRYEWLGMTAPAIELGGYWW
jgi:hypothetical protein